MEWEKSGISIARSCKFKMLSCDNLCLARIPERKFSTCFMSLGWFTDRCECGGTLVTSFLYTFIELVVSHCSFIKFLQLKYS